MISTAVICCQTLFTQARQAIDLIVDLASQLVTIEAVSEHPEYAYFISSDCGQQSRVLARQLSRHYRPKLTN